MKLGSHVSPWRQMEHLTPRLAIVRRTLQKIEYEWGNSSSQVNHDPMYLTNFGDDSTEPPAFSCCRDDALVD